ncbi:MAG: ribonuclease E/G [Planctomycetota bacterium]
MLKAMRDLFAPDIDEVVADSRDVYLRIKDFTEKLMPHMAERLRRHESTTPIFHSFGIEKEVQELYQPKIEMENGITLVVEQTEALVAIDVNSGRFKPGTNLEETAYRTNMEAAPEIARQLRLRDLGGVIICDFIDMTQEKHKRAVERKLIESLRGERARIKVGKVSPFGMLELTRQRVGPGLKRTVFNPCSHCGGAGLARTVASKALAVLRDVRALLQLKGFSIIQVFVAPPVNDYLVNHKRRAILDLEEAVGKSIVVKGEPSYPVDVVHFRFLTADNQEARVAVPPGLGVSV